MFFPRNDEYPEAGSAKGAGVTASIHPSVSYFAVELTRFLSRGIEAVHKAIKLTQVWQNLRVAYATNANQPIKTSKLHWVSWCMPRLGRPIADCCAAQVANPGPWPTTEIPRNTP